MQRSRLTREKIAQAVLDIIRAGNLNPTSEDVAQYAGVGHRTVFRHFQDMESLFETMNTKVRSLALALVSETRCEGPMAQRIEQVVSNRAIIFEQITAYYLSGEIRAHSSPALQRARAQFAVQQRRQLAAFLPEIGDKPHIAPSIELLTSIDAWLRLRRTQNLSVNQSKQAVVSAVTRLLED